MSDAAFAAFDRWVTPVVVACWLAGAALSRRVGMWWGIGGVAVALGASLVIVDGRRLRALTAPTPRPIALGLAAGVLMTVATYPMYGLLVELVPAVARDVEGLYAQLGDKGFALRAFAVLPVVVAEEVVWRGSVQGALARRAGLRVGAVLAAALYGLAHAPVGSPSLVAIAFACGLVWSGLRAATASVLAPVIAHVLWDEVVVFLLPVR